MEWADVKGILAKVAPVIGTAIGGPVGGAADAILSSVLGIDGSDPEQVYSALSTADSDKLLELKRADNDFKVKMAELGFNNVKDLAALEVEDRKDARQREIATQDWFPKAFAIAIALGFFAIVGIVLKYGIPEMGSDAALILLGTLGSAFTGVVAYYFGSSSGSAAKQNILFNKGK